MEWSLRTGIVLTPDRRSPSAVARIEPISRATRSAPVDPARGTDLHERSQVLPGAHHVPPADVLKFQECLFGPVAGDLNSSHLSRTADAPAAAFRAATLAHDLASNPEASPADRIAATLAHLRQLRGL